MNHNERYEASQSCAKLYADGMISWRTRNRIISEIAQTTHYTYSDISNEVERLISLYEEGELA